MKSHRQYGCTDPCAAHAASEREENTIMTQLSDLGQRLFLLVSLLLLGMVGYAADSVGPLARSRQHAPRRR